MELGQNITATIEGDKLTLVIDLGTTIGVSKSGKSIMIATTAGNQLLPGSAVRSASTSIASGSVRIGAQELSGWRSGRTLFSTWRVDRLKDHLEGLGA